MIDAAVTKMFFDRKAILDAADKAKIKVLRKAGWQTQQEAKKSLVYRAKIRKPKLSPNKFVRKRQLAAWYAAKKADAAPAGSPPFIRSKRYPSLATIIYAYNPATESVIIGPIERRSRTSESPVPQINEKGGTTIINVKAKSGTRPVRAKYPARPVMVPAMTKTLPAFPGLTKDSIVGPS